MKKFAMVLMVLAMAGAAWGGHWLDERFLDLPHVSKENVPQPPEGSDGFGPGYREPEPTRNEKKSNASGYEIGALYGEWVRFKDGTCAEIYCSGIDPSRCAGKIVPCPPEPPRQCWEYLVEQRCCRDDSLEVIPKLKKMGNDMWELVQIPLKIWPDNDVWIFKRPTPCKVK